MQRLAAAEADPLDVRDGGVLRDLEERGHGLTGRLEACRNDARGRVEAATPHLLGEAHRARDVAVDPWLEDERAASTRPFDPTLADELAQGVTDGDQAAAVTLGELPFGGHAVAWTPLSGIERGLQVPEDLVVQWDWATFQLKARHATLATDLDQ